MGGDIEYDSDVEATTGHTFADTAIEDEGPKQLSRRQKRKQHKLLKQQETEQIEKDEDSRRAARSWDNETKQVTRLPIKINNKVIPIPARVKEEDASATEDAEEHPPKKSKQEEKDEAIRHLSPAALLAHRKEQIATACSAVMESPDTNIGQLSDIIELCTSNDRGIAYAVRKLAIASLTTVFKDVIPGYHIRQLTETEQAQRVSKDVKKIRMFETGLLKNYQKFLKALHEAIKEYKQQVKAYTKKYGQQRPVSVATPHAKEMKRVASTALLATRSLCQLLASAPHFNFRNNIISVIAPLMTGKDGIELSKITVATAINIFKEDQAYDASLALAKAISQEIRSHNYSVEPEMVGCLRFAKIQERHVKAKKRDAAQNINERHQNKYKQFHKQKGQKNNKANRRQRKEVKAEKELARELMGTESEANKRQLEHNQTQILKVIFAVYFRVLKHARNAPILPVVLEGIAHFAHLIDVAVFMDMLEVLKEVIASPSLPLPVTMTAISAAMTLLAEEHSLSTIDPTQFLKELFQHMPETVFHPDLFGHVLSCVHIILIRRKEVSIDRVAGLVKRLTDIMLHLPHHHVVGGQALLRDVVRKYSRIAPMLENDIIATGIFQDEAGLPEHTNALATALWEAVLLQKHYHPYVVMFNRHLLSGAPLVGAGRLPPEHVKATFKEYQTKMAPFADGMNFVPTMQSSYRRPRTSKKWRGRCPAVEMTDDEITSVDFAGSLWSISQQTDSALEEATASTEMQSVDEEEASPEESGIDNDDEQEEKTASRHAASKPTHLTIPKQAKQQTTSASSTTSKAQKALMRHRAARR
eukprot:m.65281 g.65281  ORF g.65281 m.65281 type:complete len:816 (-) comp13535_c0_seq1:299-2746(-)